MTSPDGPRFLVTGANGQVGFELVRELSALGRVVAPLRGELDLSQPDSIRAAVRRLRPSAIVNAAAYTAVDRAESEPALCTAVNAEAPAVLAEEARRAGAVLIHYSTDYVFDGGKSSPYVETDAPGPLNVYGQSKLDGENAIATVGGAWIVLRTSWVYGRRGANFLNTMLRLGAERDELRVVSDQIGAPTWSRTIASVTAQLLARAGGAGDLFAQVSASTGVYHLASAGTTSWYGFACAILDGRRFGPEQLGTSVIPIRTDEYPTAAQRPRWSVLNCDKLAGQFGLRVPSWESQLQLALE